MHNAVITSGTEANQAPSFMTCSSAPTLSHPSMVSCCVASQKKPFDLCVSRRHDAFTRGSICKKEYVCVCESCLPYIHRDARTHIHALTHKYTGTP